MADTIAQEQEVLAPDDVYMVIALAGRRIDSTAPAPARFPLENTELVRVRLRSSLQRMRPEALVSSAACGADLLALDEAGLLGIRRRVVLPFEPERFRRTSVVDRAGEWGPLFDRIIEEVGTNGDLVISRDQAAGHDAYAAITAMLFNQAAELAQDSDGNVTAVLVWDGQTRGSGDLSFEFGEEARRRGLRVVEVNTLRAGGGGRTDF